MTRKGVDFVPRGANYVQFTAGADRALDPGWFDGAAMNTAFSDRAARSYNTVRIFLDSCQCSSTRSWLDRAHPGEDEILYDGTGRPRFLAESLALWEIRVAEWIASLDD